MLWNFYSKNEHLKKMEQSHCYLGTFTFPFPVCLEAGHIFFIFGSLNSSSVTCTQQSPYPRYILMYIDGELLNLKKSHILFYWPFFFVLLTQLSYPFYLPDLTLRVTFNYCQNLPQKNNMLYHLGSSKSVLWTLGQESFSIFMTWTPLVCW